MPIYEYRCNACGHHFEVSQRMSDDPITECEKCEGEVQRLLFAPAIHFKGTGFHNTDYGTRKRPKESDSSSSDSSSPGSAEGGGDGSAKSADSGGGDAGGGEKKVKEATPASTAARTTGP